MGEVLRIAVPKEFLNQDLEDYLLWHGCERIDGKNTVVFETFPHPIGIFFEVFGVSSYKKKRDFYDGLIVEGGKKAFSRQSIIINPLLNKEVSIRLTEEAHQFIREMAKRQRCSVSDYLRALFIEHMIRREPKSEKERRGQEIASRCFAAATTDV